MDKLKSILQTTHHQIFVVSESQGSNMQLTVRDTGVGMSEEHYKNLFLLGEKHSSSGTSGEKGVGLGLQLVNDFVKLNKGKIEVESREGEGTSFMVSLKTVEKITVDEG